MALRNANRVSLDGTTIAAQDCDPGNLRSKNVDMDSIAVATTGSQEILVTAPCAGTLAGVTFCAAQALAANNTNYLTFTLVNKGQAGTGTTQLLAASPANTTQATGGAAIAAYTPYPMTLAAPANLTVNKGDVLALTIAATGTLANSLSEGYVRFDFAFSAN
jgi:hypothetical protein